MRYLRANTATRIIVGPFIDGVDGVTPEASLTVTTLKLNLNVANSGVPLNILTANATAANGNNDMIHIANDTAGYYDLELTAAQTNYAGDHMTLGITSATANATLPVFHEFQILPAQVYDSLINANDQLQVHANEITASLIANTTFAANAITAAVIADGAIDAATFAANAIAAGTIADGAIDAATFAANAITAAAIADSAIDIATFAADAKTGSYINAQVKAQDNIAFGALQLANLNSATPASVGTANTVAALAANCITAASIAADAGTEIAAAMFSADAGVYATAHANSVVKQTSDNASGSGATAAEVRAEMDANSTRLANIQTKTDNIPASPAAVGSAMTLAANAVTAASLDPDAGTELGTAVWATVARTLTSNANFNDPTAATIADAVWDEISTGHVDAGKAGQQLWTDVDAVAANTASLVTGVNVSTIAANAITAASIASDSGTEIGTAVWATAARTLTAATNITSTGGTTVPQTGDSFARIGAPAGANLAADIAAIEAQTDDIGVAGAGLSAVPWNVAWAANIEAAVDAAFENAIPASPTANSINAYLQKMKWVLTNKMTIEESSANTVIFKDDGTTPAYSVSAMFASDAGTTTRKAAA